jgi:succinate dehydrogenase/fumarate reductase flavoprotein subunit
MSGLELRADVLVLGGGPAGTWAAEAAARAGASVVLADKAYCGTSGAAAAGGNNVWYVPPDDAARDASIRRREAAGGYLTERRWMERTVDQAWRSLIQLARWGYPFPRDEHGEQLRGSLQGPEYLRLMRRQVRRAGVRILDHSPALELLVTADGMVAGAAGTRRQHGWQPWRVQAGAVVLATGGCAFLSGALGLNVDTGDGHLMAAELGAQLSGMEFSCAYAIAPAFGAQTKGLMYQFASYTYADGSPVPGAGGLAGRAAVARALLEQPVYARLDQAGPEIRSAMRWSQPNFFLPFQKAGIDPFEQRFPIRMVLEGTVRGTGGLRLVDEDCATTVPGLYAAGDVATRELVTGGISGGGSHNAAWAMSSGAWAGAAAARFARARGTLPSPAALSGAGQAGLRPAERDGGLDPVDLVEVVRRQVTPLDRNMFRTAAGLGASLDELDHAWRAASGELTGVGRDGLRARQAAAMVAHARWMYRGALARGESRAMHRREDRPATEPALARRLRCGGLSRVWVAAEHAGAATARPADGAQPRRPASRGPASLGSTGTELAS